jgi:thiamine biosynthesis lipoprotein
VPDRNALARARSQVGYEKLKLYSDGEAELLIAGMKIDLGGVGKGYAVDRVANRLKAAGVTSALINFGGSSIYAIGAPPGEPGWEIGVLGPDENLRGLLHLNNLALSTSGSMGRFWTIRGKKYGHLINPKSGIPVSEPRMATVIAPTATAAEALTKPFVLLGKDGFWTIGRLQDTEAVFISETGRLFFSKNFRSKTRWREVPRG